MAQVVTRQLLDDLDGSEADETVTFGVDNVAYEIDLSSDHARELRDELARFLAKARRLGRFSVGGSVGTARRSTSSNGAGHSREQTQAIRSWAEQNGFSVSKRGRISSQVQEAFDAAHQSSAAPAVSVPAYHSEIHGWA